MGDGVADQVFGPGQVREWRRYCGRGVLGGGEDEEYIRFVLLQPRCVLSAFWGGATTNATTCTVVAARYDS